MASFAVGRLEEFNPDIEPIEEYLERVELYFEANEIKKEKQVAVFLSVIGRENYSLLRKMLSPVKPREKTLKELMEILQRHFEPKKVVCAPSSIWHCSEPTSLLHYTYFADITKCAFPCISVASLSQAYFIWGK